MVRSAARDAYEAVGSLRLFQKLPDTAAKPDCLLTVVVRGAARDAYGTVGSLRLFQKLPDTAAKPDCLLTVVVRSAARDAYEAVGDGRVASAEPFYSNTFIFFYYFKFMVI
ncbi:MAG: hypothetical protein LBD24_08715 [Spirochaetaceae bacterium]|nr:hypothetical protein [Spirochaetaceae bacterium]